METETIEAMALTDDSLPAASSSKSVNDGGSGIGEKGDGSEGQRIGASQSIHQKMIYGARARKAAEAKEVWMSAVVVRINEVCVPYDTSMMIQGCLLWLLFIIC